MAGEQRGFGPSAATMLATEHWSLLGTRAMIWNEAMSRATVFLTVVSAAVVALALVGNATDFGRPFTSFALVLLPAVLFLGLATYTRTMQINTDDTYLVHAMNRLRHAYLDMEPGLARYFTASPYDDGAGILATFTLGEPLMPRWVNLMGTTPTIIATIDAVLASAIAGLAASQFGGTDVAVFVAAALAFAVVLTALFWLEGYVLARISRNLHSRFPTPPDSARKTFDTWWTGGRTRPGA